VGQVRTGERLTQTYRLVNDGAATIEELEARPDCGCLAARVSSTQLAPGQAGTVTMHVNTIGQASGPHTWRATLHYRDNGVPRQTVVELRANLITEVNVQPAALTLFTDGALRHEIVLTDMRATPLRITAVQTTIAGIQARAQQPERNAQGHTVNKIVIEASLELPPGRHEDTLSIFTDDPAYRHLQMPVRVLKQVKSSLSVGPRELSFSRSAGVSARLIRVWSGADLPVDVVRIYADHPALTCTWAAGPENQATVKVQVDRARLSAESLETAVHIEVRAPVCEVVTIPVVVEDVK